MSAHVVIIGGGISGLAALEHLAREAPWIRVTLLESGDRLGGHIRTVRTGGLVIETGPDVILTAKPAALDLARRIGLADRICGTNPDVHGSYISSGGSLRRMPDGLTGLVPSRFRPFISTPLISPLGKARVAFEYLLPKGSDTREESIEHFVVRRFGREMYDRLVEPLLSGISAGDGARLSIDAMFPQLRSYEREHGGLIRGVLARRGRETAPRATSPFASFPTGLQELVDGIERFVHDADPEGSRVRIRRGARGLTITRHVETPAEPGLRYDVWSSDGERIPADCVVVATPAFAAAALLADLDRALAGHLATIEYSSTVTITLSYPCDAVPRPLDATGYVVPRIERRPVLACTWSSAKFSGRAPAGTALFRLFLGGIGRRDFVARDDRDLMDIARAEMRDVMGITAEPALARIDRHARAMPQYTVGHRDRIARILAAAAHHRGLALAGAIYTGLGIPDCIASGVFAARQALASLPLAHHTFTGDVS